MVTDISFPPMAVVDFKIMTPLTDVNDEIPHLDDLQDSYKEQSDLDDPDFIDGRCDSPGYSIKYGTYSLLSAQLNKVTDFHVVHVSTVENSSRMEA